MKVGQVWAELGLDDKKFNSGLDKAGGRAKTAGTTIGKMFANSFSIAAGIGLEKLVSAAFDGMKEAVIGYNARLQQTTIGLETMLGSAAAAEEMLTRMQKFAAETPFTFDDVANATKKFLAFGWAAEDVLPTLQAVGDAASGLGIGAAGINRITLAMGQIRAKGRVQGEELMQLAEAGIPAYDILAKKLNLTGKEVANIADQGINADIAIKALVAGMNERFGGMMKKQAESWQGLTSTIKDNATQITAALGKQVFDGMLEGLKGVRDETDRLMSILRSEGVGGVWKDLFGEQIIDSMNRLSMAMTLFNDSLKTLKEGMAGLNFGSAIKNESAGALDGLNVIFRVLASWNNAYDEMGKYVVGVMVELGTSITSITDEIGKELEKHSGVVASILPEAWRNAAKEIGSVLGKLGGWILDKLKEWDRELGLFLGVIPSGPEDDKGQRHRDRQEHNRQSALSGHKPRPPVDFGGGGGKGADKYANSLQKLSEIMASLNEKIMSETGTEYQKAIAKIDAEVVKLKNDLVDLDKAGVDTSGARKKLDEMKSVLTMSAGDKQKNALSQLVEETKLMNAEITGDYAKAAAAQLQIDLLKNAEKKKELAKTTGDEAAALIWLAEANRQSQEKQVQTVIEGNARKHEQRLTDLQYQRDLLGMTGTAYTDAYQAELRAFIDANTKMLQVAGLSEEKRARIKQETSAAIVKLHQLEGQNIGTAWGEAMRRMSAEAYDYAGRIVSMFGEMGSSISTALYDTITGTGEGVKDIFASICGSIIKMWADMITQMYIMAPMKSLFGSIFGIGGGLGSSIGGSVGNGGWIGNPLVASGANGYDVPNIAGDIPMFVHKREMVLPAHLADRVRNATSQKSSIGDVHLAFSPTINVASGSKEDANNMMTQVKQQWGAFRNEFINDLKNHTGVRSAVKGVK